MQSASSLFANKPFQLPEEVYPLIDKADIVVFEGFEMVGKSFLMKEIGKMFNLTISYRPDWEGAMSDSVISRGNRYIPGLAVVDFWKNASGNFYGSTPRLLIDRWIAVSYVYQSMYSQKNDLATQEALIESAKLVVDDLNIIFIHKKHASEEDAKAMYEFTMSRSKEHDDIYDKFHDFEEYYQHYLQFEDCYEEFYRRSGFPVVFLSSIGNEVLKEME